MSEPEPQGLGGWLVLVAIGLVLTPIRNGVVIAKDLVPIVTNGYWTALTDPAGAAYHPLWAPLLIFEFVGNLAFIALSIYALLLFSRRSSRFPTLMVRYYVASLLFGATDYFAVEAIPSIAAQNDVASTRELIRGIMTCLIWVPYMYKSRRVRNTFVEPRAVPPPAGPEPSALA